MNLIWDGPLSSRGWIPAIRYRAAGLTAALLTLGAGGQCVPLQVGASGRAVEPPLTLFTPPAALGQSARLPTTIRTDASRLPLAFEPTSGGSFYTAHAAGYQVWVGSGGAALALRQADVNRKDFADAPRMGRLPQKQGSRHWVGIHFEGGRDGIRGVPQTLLPSRVHRLHGNDPKEWHTGISVHARVAFSEVYPGIDAVFHGKDRQLEFDFQVAPGADPSLVRLRFEGADSLELAADGGIRVETPAGPLVQRPPIAYQDGPGGREFVRVEHRLQADGTVAFALESYDSRRPLVIDPVLSYATFLGGSGFDQSWDLAVGQNGSVYVVGETESVEFSKLQIISTNAFLTHFQGGLTNVSGDAFVAKLNPEGTAFEWFTYLGGEDLDGAFTLTLAEGEEPVVGGFTSSTNFPVTTGAFQNVVRGLTNQYTGRRPLDGFVARLSADGAALVASTLYGGDGEDQVIDVAVLPDGRTLAVGSTTSTNLPVPETAPQPLNGGGVDGFLALLAPDATSLVAATYLGGSARDSIEGVAVDGAGVAHLAGITLSTNLPVLTPLQSTNAGLADIFHAGFRTADHAWAYSTYLGGTGDDFAYRVVLDHLARPWSVGETRSTNFPVVASLQSTNAGGSDGVITRLANAGATLEFSTYLGGTLADALWDIHVDAQENVHVVGESFSSRVTGITTNSLQAANAGLSDVLIARLRPDGVLAATFHGSANEEAAYGVGADTAGNAYFSGSTRSAGFPISGTNVAQVAYGGGLSDAFVLKLTYEPQLVAVPSDEGIEVSWPAPNAGFVLESASALEPAGTWDSVTSPREISAGRHRVLLPLSATNSLFRLRWSPAGL
jgi:hypothetical protein